LLVFRIGPGSFSRPQLIMLRLLEAQFKLCNGTDDRARTHRCLSWLIGTGRTRVSNILRSLEDRGLMVREARRLAGFRRVAVVVRLTGEGEREARRLRREALGSIVLYRGKSLRLGRVLRMLPRPKSLALAARCTSRGIVDHRLYTQKSREWRAFGSTRLLRRKREIPDGERR
jgi:DNA-binding MarR family transcriptional regulator